MPSYLLLSYMNTLSNTLEKIGFGAWLHERVPAGRLEHFDPARVVAVHKDSYIVSNGEVVVPGELAGKILFSNVSAVDYPAVGDWVLANFHDDYRFAIIHEILPRKSILKRKTPGRRVDIQMIAANIDVAFIVQSLNENFNLRRLERYLVMVNDAKIQPVVLLSKSDLLDGQAIAGIIEKIHHTMPQLQVVPFSNENTSCLDSVKGIMQAGLTYCLLGSSGVGKTTLINNLLGTSTYITKTVSKKESKGRHATTYRQLVMLDFGAMVVDTPGMRELGNFAVAKGLGDTFAEISELSEKCHFNDCAHVTEKGCAVLQAVENDQLSAERYRNFIKMNRESNFNNMSYLEKRKKEKQFGKFVKTAMKHKKNRR